jgi:hypothetical protein
METVRPMRQFHFADAVWFRVPVRVVVVAVTAFALVTVWPALTGGTPEQRAHAISALGFVIVFVAIATVVTVAVNESYIEFDERLLHVRFEAFFSAELRLADIVAIRDVDPRPRWRFRFGLSTDFRDRICCSHGGRIVELELERPWRTRIWPRTIEVTRFWFAVREHEEFVSELQRRIGAGSVRELSSLREAA